MENCFSFPFSWESYGIPIPTGNSIPMHISSTFVQRAVQRNEQIYDKSKDLQLIHNIVKCHDFRMLYTLLYDFSSNKARTPHYKSVWAWCTSHRSEI